MIKNSLLTNSGCRICLSTLLVTVGLMSGCSGILQTPPISPITSPPYIAEIHKLESGYEAFRQGDLKTAEEIFGRLHQQTGNQEISRDSLYGLTCARLILAEDPDDFTEAIRLWDAWSQLLPPNLSGEDPRMLGPLLHEMAESGTAEARVPENEPTDEPPDEPPPPANESEPRQNVKKQPDKSAFYKKLIKAREKEIQRLDYRLEKMKKENRTLKHQIEALETIHLNIQEKKKEISSP
jgi:hypothetical protein